MSLSVLCFIQIKKQSKHVLRSVGQTFTRSVLCVRCYERFLKVKRHGGCSGSSLLVKGEAHEQTSAGQRHVECDRSTVPGACHAPGMPWPKEAGGGRRKEGRRGKRRVKDFK